MDKPVLRVALAGSQMEAVELLDESRVDIAFHPNSDGGVIYAVCTFSTEEKLPRGHVPYARLDWHTAVATNSRRSWNQSYAVLYKLRVTFDQVVNQLKEYFEVEIVEKE